jgi:hypothetical protein
MLIKIFNGRGDKRARKCPGDWIALLQSTQKLYQSHGEEEIRNKIIDLVPFKVFQQPIFRAPVGLFSLG